MDYSFDIEQAKKYGVDEAILLKNLIFWISKNKANNENEFEGRTWTYNSVEAFTKLFPFWNSKTIRRILKSLEDKEVIITGRFNKSSYDRTLWYALKDESILINSNSHFTKQENGDSEKGKPIPYINTDSKLNIKEKSIINNTLKEKQENPKVNEIVEKLKSILEKYKGRSLNTSKWKEPISKMLRIDKLNPDEIIDNLEWYADYIGDDYIPVIESGSSLREKYGKLEYAMNKKKKEVKEKYQPW